MNDNELGTIADHIDLPVVLPTTADEQYVHLCDLAGLNPRYVKSITAETRGSGGDLEFEFTLRPIRIPTRSSD